MAGVSHSTLPLSTMSHLALVLSTIFNTRRTHATEYVSVCDCERPRSWLLGIAWHGIQRQVKRYPTSFCAVAIVKLLVTEYTLYPYRVQIECLTSDAPIEAEGGVKEVDGTAKKKRKQRIASWTSNPWMKTFFPKHLNSSSRTCCSSFQFSPCRLHLLRPLSTPTLVYPLSVDYVSIRFALPNLRSPCPAHPSCGYSPLV